MADFRSIVDKVLGSRQEANKEDFTKSKLHIIISTVAYGTPLKDG